MHQDLLLDNTSGEELYASVHRPEGSGPFPVVVVCHGFKGFKDWGFFPYLCDRLAESGLAALRFNFSHCGVVGHGDEYNAMERFAHNTIGRELVDLEGVLTEVHEGRISGLDGRRIGLFGHSRGGGIVLLGADHLTHARCAATWAAVSTFDRFTPESVEAWRRAGTYTVQNARTGQEMPMDIEILTDFEANREAYDIEAAIARLRIPLLFVQGEEDTSVSPFEMETLLAASGGRAETLLIPGANHTMNARHPFTDTSPELEAALDRTLAFYARHLA